MERGGWRGEGGEGRVESGGSRRWRGEGGVGREEGGEGRVEWGGWRGEGGGGGAEPGFISLQWKQRWGKSCSLWSRQGPGKVSQSPQDRLVKIGNVTEDFQGQHRARQAFPVHGIVPTGSVERVPSDFQKNEMF